MRNGLVLELCHCSTTNLLPSSNSVSWPKMAAFKLYTEAPWRPETQGFIPSWWQGRSANLQTTTLSRCTVQNKHHQKSAWFASACPNLISANQSYHVWNARHCFKLYYIFFCALWVSKFTWFQHWEKEILRIMFLLLGNDAPARWRCSWSASSWTLMLWLARQSHEIRDDYVQLQRFRVCLPLPIVALLKQEFFDVVKATQALWSAGEECQEISFGIIYVSLTYET